MILQLPLDPVSQKLEDIFISMFTDALMEDVVKQSNIHAEQQMEPVSLASGRQYLLGN